MFMVRLMIILFQLKSDKLYCIGVMNQLKVICYDSFFVHRKMSFHWFNRKELLQKAKDRCHNGGGKKKATDYCLKNSQILKRNRNNKYRNL